MSGPVSAVLEQEVLGELRRQGIVVWLDRDAAYTRFVDDLAKGSTGAPLFCLELGCDIVVEGERRSHVLMLDFEAS